jgi:hypothetical protein
VKERPVAVLDACVLIPMPVADTLLRLAEPPALYEPRWTHQILAEVTRTLIVRFGKTPEKALYRETARREFFSEAMVRNYEPLIAKMKNHPKDRHVLAAAVACRADYLVIFNLKDFPPAAVHKYKNAVIGPSTFLTQLAVLNRAVVEQRLGDQAAAIGMSINDLLDRLAGSVPGFVSLLRQH